MQPLTWLTEPSPSTGVHLADAADGWEFLPYPKLAGAARRVAAALVADGVRPGDTVCVLMPTGYPALRAIYGAWAAGAGIEYGLTDHLSARLEYLYLDTGDIMTGVIGPPATTITTQLKDNLVRAALNYRFSVPVASVLVSKN